MCHCYLYMINKNMNLILNPDRPAGLELQKQDTWMEKPPKSKHVAGCSELTAASGLRRKIQFVVNKKTSLCTNTVNVSK